MKIWAVVEIHFDGSKRVLDGRYATWDEACEVQEAMEWLHDENCYLILPEYEVGR